VIGIIGLLLAILAPGLARARQQARQVVCGSNIRQLAIADVGYAGENNDHFVPAASDISDSSCPGGGRHRWHGVRESCGVSGDPKADWFDPRKGPLAGYLSDGVVKQCPEFAPEKTKAAAAFELGTGGYGYNIRGVGSSAYVAGGPDPFGLGVQTSQIRRPAETVMFTDAALPRGHPAQHLIEYSFAEAPLWVFDMGSGAEPMAGFFADPSIHFRHGQRSNVAWCDGHVGGEPMTWTTPTNVYGGNNRLFGVGWFGPEDNSLFDPF
jgi:prepilin-type processing-associated H-X9-DG protein